jgi:hypothetical protein
MKDVLKSMFKENLIDKVESYDFIHYEYFIDENEAVFGIAKEVLSVNEKRLIGAHYELVDEDYINLNHSKLLKYLFGETETVESTSIKYYLIRTFKPIERDLMRDFIELLKDSFTHEVIITRRKEIYIILTHYEEELDFYNLLKSIESDFMIPLMGYVSEISEVNQTLSQSFQFNFHELMQLPYSDEVIVHKAMLSQHYILQALKALDHKFLKDYVLKGYKDDLEMIQVIKAYFESNFNTSMAAKMCYMHRNTLINKIDRFSQDTQFNLRQYEDAFMVYLTILL